MNRRKISVGKMAVDILLISGVVIAGGVIADDIKQTFNANRAEELQAGAAVQTAVVENHSFSGSKSAPEFTVPTGDTSFKSYMDFRCITNKDSEQWALQEGCWTDDTGLRRYGDDYVIALGSYYASYIGERFTITLDSGETFTAVVGDFKADIHTDESNRYTPMSEGRKNIVEFVVDTNELDSTAKKMGDISYIDNFEGNVRSVEWEK